MTRLRRHNSIRAMLVLALLTNSVGVHGYTHSHSDGDAPHAHDSHATAATAESDHPCSLALEHFHDDCRAAHLRGAAEHQLSKGQVAHSHLNVFGIDFSIPTPIDSQESHESQHSLAFLRINDEPAIAPTLRVERLDFLRTTLFASQDSITSVAESAAVQSSPQVFTPPLCDGARLERSGVLLI